MLHSCRTVEGSPNPGGEWQAGPLRCLLPPLALCRLKAKKEDGGPNQITILCAWPTHRVIVYALTRIVNRKPAVSRPAGPGARPRIGLGRRAPSRQNAYIIVVYTQAKAGSDRSWPQWLGWLLGWYGCGYALCGG